jgi:ring-1,2-phenylacetyl-CoA epoxidase subunit PaaE
MAALNLGSRRRARFHTLAVRDVRRLTADSIEVTFAVPHELAGDYDYAPGQYVALRSGLASPDGAELRRSYSICQPPVRGELKVAIKRDVGGVFSSWANEHLEPGMSIDVMSPQGTFTTDLTTCEHKHFAAIAAGSGITPLMALILEELADLKDRYRERLALHHVLSREERTSELLSGRIDDEKIDGILQYLVPPADVDEWFLCGPFDLVELCRGKLGDAGVHRSAVHFELFTTGRPEFGSAGAVGRPADREAGINASTVKFTLDGRTSTVVIPERQAESILNAALRVRTDVPFACAGGVCGTCRAKLVDGTVRMTENYALEPEELDAGYVLTCQSHPTSDAVAVDYDF